MSYGNVFDPKNKKSLGDIWKPDAVGAECAGVLVGRENFDSEYKGTPTKQRKYTLIQEDGTPVTVFGRYGKPGEYKAFPEFDTCALGSLVGVKYIGEKVPKSGGLPYKVVDVFVSDTIKEDVLASYDSSESAQESSELPPL